jgi:hypothetical protein
LTIIVICFSLLGYDEHLMGLMAGKLGCYEATDLLSLIAFQPPSLKPAKLIPPNEFLTHMRYREIVFGD